MQETIEGKVEKVNFFNPQNNYTVAKISTEDSRLVTIVGNLCSLASNQSIKASGTWQKHPKFGMQFMVHNYELLRPGTVDEIEKYLSSGIIKGIGAATARKIVGKFGDKTIDILDNDIDRLHEIPKLGKSKIELIKIAWFQQKEQRDAILFLQRLGISSGMSAKIYSIYGINTVEFVKENPYQLIQDVPGIGFVSVDQLAFNLGIDAASRLRIKAGIVYILGKFSEDGHVYFPLGHLVRECFNVLCVDHDSILEAIQELDDERRIFIENFRLNDWGNEEALNDPDKRVYLLELYEAEKGIERILQEILKTPSSIKVQDVDAHISLIQEEQGIRYSDNQLRAIKEVVTNKLVVITGGPGTGKTTIIKSIIQIFSNHSAKVLLTAPTGRAAKKMSETTGLEAKTVHRLLEYNPIERIFIKDEDNQLNTELLILDEASMIDVVLFFNLLKAIPRRAVVVLIGDIDQLPSIGPGNVLKDVINSGFVSTVRLTEIFRQCAESLIIINAHRINKGEMPVLVSSQGYSSEDFQIDFVYYQMNNAEQIVNKILDLCHNELPAEYNCDPINDIQVLIPMHKGVVGVSNLNTELQRVLNPYSEGIHFGSRIYKVGDKVMQNRNNYQKEVFNGDLGRIYLIDKDEGELIVDFEGRKVRYTNIDIDELILAYAVTVHKSQGSEYPIIVMALLPEHYMLLQRNLLYTGITRGKKHVVLIGNDRAIMQAVNNNKSTKRFTFLKERLAGIIKKD